MYHWPSRESKLLIETSVLPLVSARYGAFLLLVSNLGVAGTALSWSPCALPALAVHLRHLQHACVFHCLHGLARAADAAMQQQQQAAPFRAQLMNSFHTLIADESEEVMGKVALAVMRLDDRECENLLNMAGAVRRAALLQLAQGQQAGGH